MPPESIQLETLKYILENCLVPQRLDSHPWADSLFAREAEAGEPGAQEKSPGQRLVLAIGKLFTQQMMPSTAPRQGKRLDTRWGEFGLLAAQYFAPLLFGTPFPASLRDAWGRIDQSILLFVYGKPEDALTVVEKETYKLAGDELEVAPNSTLSDWHRKGLQRLAEIILARENYLSKSLSRPAVISQDGRTVVPAENPSPMSDSTKGTGKARRSGRRRFIFAILGLILLGLLLVGGLKGRQVYNQAMLVYQDATAIQELASGSASTVERVRSAGPALLTLRQDFDALKDETEPFLRLGPWLDWVPVYGGDLASIQDLVTLADSLLASAEVSYQALTPVLDAYEGESDFDPAGLVELLNQAQPQLLEARASLDLAVAARARLDPQQLSPRVRDLILTNVDRVLPLLDEGLLLGVELPRVVGASSEGPKTYLLLAQNEDELRPSGGFITAAGTLLLQDGRIGSLTFQNSGNFDNWDRPYPAAPWQLDQYMNSRVLIFRDANWFTDFRTAALYAEYLYSYANNHSVDGVIAFNQHMLVETLRVTGPIELEGEAHPVDANNVVTFMRAEKTPTAEDLASPEWNNKVFINKIITALIKKILSGDVPLEQLSVLFVKSLNEHHLMVQLDNPTLTDFLARHNWDGAVRPAEGDFLMVVDSNVGFNKTNAVIESSLSYDVDLTKPGSPIGTLVVFHKNNAVGIDACQHWDKVRAPGEEDYPIQDCYWDYLRFYTLPDTDLLGASVQTIPGEWMILGRTVPPQVDILEEEIEGVRGFGTMKVVPAGESLSTSFRFALPPGVLEAQPDPGEMAYRLKIQKQPGTLGVPITVRVHLPNGERVSDIRQSGCRSFRVSTQSAWVSNSGRSL